MLSVITIQDGVQKMKLFPNEILYPTRTIIHKIGNIYHKEDDGYSILSQIDNNKVCLIILQWGRNRWSAPVLVKDLDNIAIDEWKKISDTYDNWIYIGRIKKCMRSEDSLEKFLVLELKGLE